MIAADKLGDAPPASFRTSDRFDFNEPLRRDEASYEQRCDSGSDAIEHFLAHRDQCAHILAPHEEKSHLHDVTEGHIGFAQDGFEV